MSGLSVILALALSGTFLGLESALADSVIATITVGTGPYGAIFNPITGHVYTADIASSTVSVIDTTSNNVLTTIHLPNNYTPRELALDTKRNYIYTANIFSNTLSVIDAATNNVIDTVQSSGSIVDGVTYDPVNDHIYAVNAGSGTVSVIDGATRGVIDTVTVGGDPKQGVFDPSNGLTYIPNRGSGTISVINGASRTVVATVTNVPNPVFLTYDSANGNIYAANHDTKFVSVIDTSTNSVTKTITVGPDPTGVGFDADNGVIYVGNQGSNYVSLIDGSSNQVTGTITVGSGPVTPVYDQVHHNVYVTNYNSNGAPGNTVSVISTTPPTPPNTSITSAIDGNNNPVQNSGSTISTSITFQVSATPGSNPISGFECSLDNSAFSTCGANTNPNSGTVSYNNLGAGQQHTFKVRAADTQGNKDPSPATFSWTILTLQQAVQNIITTIDNMHLSHGVTTSLEAPLNAALGQLNRNNHAAACNTLNAFLNQVKAKEGNGQLTSQQAADLRQQATAIETSLGCSSTATTMTTATNNNSNNNDQEMTSSTTSSAREQQQEQALINLRNQVENNALSSHD
jgi:YVTN family beta-propeller protein